ncbi:MAG TPA: thiolase family protein [Acidimicrobiia bacterium]|nr:thiolase family protein [Acidimicrobiia bacterium]
MGDAVIVSAARTAIATARRGSLMDVDVFELAKAAISEALKRSSVPAEDVDDIVMGESLQGGGCVARYAAVDLGLVDIPGLAHNRHCASGMAPVHTAAGSIRAGMDRVVIAGGAESITQSPQSMKKLPGSYSGVQPWLSPSHPETPDAPTMDMSITVGWNTAQSCNVTREEQDEWAYHSHMRAVAAIDEGRLADEIFAMEVPAGKRGETRTFDTDEHPRRDTSMERLAKLPPLHPEIEGFSITAGNSSGLNDASCAMVVCDSDYAQEHGLDPLAIVRSWASVGVPPRDTGTAPTLAIPKAVKRAGLQLDDVKLVEINEAFASMAVASSRILGFPHEMVNVNGSGCSLGHPVAATGARMITTMIYELRRRGGGYGVTSMCAGGGMGSATVLEVLPPV